MMIKGRILKTNLAERALGGGLGDVDDLDLEVAIVARGAARGSRRLRLELLSYTLSDGSGDDSSR